MKRTKEERAKLTAERLNKVLDEVFHGDKHLLAFVMETNVVTLNGWLSGKNAVSRNKAFNLMQVVPSCDWNYMSGYSDENRPHETEYWETNDPYQEPDIYRKDILILRHLVANRDRMWQWRNKGSKR